ncbi:MAG: 2,3-bisphosphoglycerate-dependent phosphoglycerate mutase, partial [Euryarchaeota archaeon]|nr:2,3-bisphosphoglycerate-dependent phosphoglycerate mutase [Euryarchaeota archaeon]
MGLLILIRHGQSLWNAQNRFTGWVDIELSEKGMGEAKSAGEKLSGIEFDAVYASGLVRAQRTAEIILDINHSWSGEVIHDSRLNERNYGDLQGRNKQECREEFGEEQVKKWRRSFEGVPPGGESLRMTSERTLP